MSDLQQAAERVELIRNDGWIDAGHAVYGEMPRVEFHDVADADLHYADAVRLAHAYLDEHDPTPVDAEWLDGVLGDGGAKEAYAFWWISIEAMMGVARRRHGAFELQVGYDDVLGRPPTRGDVLTALRLRGWKQK